MIRKMTRYSFVLLTSQVPAFIEQVQALGLVDINRRKQAIDPGSKALWEELTAQRALIQKMTDRHKRVLSQGRPVDSAPYTGDAASLAREAQEAFAQEAEVLTRLEAARREHRCSLPWGDFTTGQIDQLWEMGLRPHAYSVAQSKFKESWADNWPLQVVNVQDGQVYFIVLEDVNREGYNFPLPELDFPCPRVQALERLQKAQEEADLLRQRVDRLSSYVHLLGTQELASRLDAYLAAHGGDKAAEESLTILTGYVPEDCAADFEKALGPQGPYLYARPATAEDDPPVALKNNAFHRLFEPIGDMYMLPTYDGLDLTPYFGIFYMFFFGLCLGDMGYGLLILLISLLGRRFAPKLRGYLNLGLFLGAGTVLASLLNGSFFGTTLAQWVPALQTAAPASGRLPRLFHFQTLDMFWFAILFGVVQLLFARVVGAISTWSRKGFVHSLAGFGWTFLILWCVMAYMGTMPESALYFKMPAALSYTLLGLGAGLILFFTQTEGNLFKRLFGGLTSFYDITGVFGDILSYIRLFGLGTSGGILAMVMNSMALSLTQVPVVGYFFGLLVLLFGHALVFGLSFLGAFVHPMRLTFVEFYKNAGFSGGGRAYRPLNKNNSNI